MCIPYLYKDTQLALWVMTQHRKNSGRSRCGPTGYIRQETKDRRDVIGFVWKNSTQRSGTKRDLMTTNEAIAALKICSLHPMQRKMLHSCIKVHSVYSTVRPRLCSYKFLCCRGVNLDSSCSKFCSESITWVPVISGDSHSPTVGLSRRSTI